MSTTAERSPEQTDQKITVEKFIEEISLSNKVTSARTNDMTSINQKQLSERMETDASYASLKTSTKQSLQNSTINLLNSNNSYETENLKKINKNIYIPKKKNAILKSIECTTNHILIESILLIVCSIMLKFFLANKKENFPIACMIISISSFLLNVFLLVAIKIGFTNAPNEMKLFRVSLITVFLVLFTNFGFQIFANVNDYLNYGEFSTIRIFSYSLLGFAVILFIPTLIKGIILSTESFLILINCKKEYKDLFVDDKEKFLAYDKFCKLGGDFRGRGSAFYNAKFMPEKEVMEKINPLFNKFHNSLRKNRNDDEFYRKIY